MSSILAQPTESSIPIVLQTYRFVFNDDLTEQLSIFAQVHQYDDRKVFKEAWNNWIEEDEIKPIIDAEINRIYENGFVGDVLDKMFKSVRYYYRKKTNTPKVQQVRKVYEGIPQTILMQMDQHIHKQINEHVQTKHNTEPEKSMDGTQVKYSVSKISPAKSFEQYCTENQETILQYIKEQTPSNETIGSEFVTETINKIKKTYKNRFYNIRMLHIQR
jgi:hypothetical protein